jgi:hypothetical protein
MGLRIQDLSRYKAFRRAAHVASFGSAETRSAYVIPGSLDGGESALFAINRILDVYL